MVTDWYCSWCVNLQHGWWWPVWRWWCSVVSTLVTRHGWKPLTCDENFHQICRIISHKEGVCAILDSTPFWWPYNHHSGICVNFKCISCGVDGKCAEIYKKNTEPFIEIIDVSQILTWDIFHVRNDELSSSIFYLVMAVARERSQFFLTRSEPQLVHFH